MLKHLSFRQKVWLLSTVLSVIPLLLINVFWLKTSQDHLKNAAADRQELLLSSAAQRLNQFIDAKVDNAIIHSQIASVRNFNIAQARLNLLEYAKQDGDLQSIALVDETGMERVKLVRLDFSEDLKNVAESDAFRLVTFLSGKEYVSEVSYDSENKPYITLAVPLVSFVNRQEGVDLSTAESGIRRGGGDIKGALIVQISLANIWQSALSERLGKEGYAYLVDDKGNLIAHPNANLLSSDRDFSDIRQVQMATQTIAASDLDALLVDYQPRPQVTTSETGEEVLSSFFPVARTRWAVIGEEPISSVYHDVNRALLIAVAFFIAAGSIATILIFVASRGLLRPIRRVAQGAQKIGEGNLEHRIPVVGKDELGQLAQNFNQMAGNLAGLIAKYRQRSIDLAAERAKLKAVIDTVADGVIALNSDFTIALVNDTAATLLNQNNETLLGELWLSVFPLSLRGRAIKNEILNEPTSFHKDLTLEIGSRRKYLDIAVVKLANDPTGLAYILTIHDTTQSRELEIMKLDFVSMAAHELRTPLTAGLGYLELIGSDESLPKDNRQNFDRAMLNLNRLKSLINNLLVLSKIERGAVALNKSEFDWNEVVREELSNSQVEAANHKITIGFEPASGPLHIKGDKLLLAEVVDNLINNALHYTQAGGKINVTVREENNELVTEITDTGIGIPAAALPQIFTKYYRVKGGLTTNSAGTGIGLFICKTIVEMHNGTISVTSVEGEGSTFTIRLPKGQ